MTKGPIYQEVCVYEMQGQSKLSEIKRAILYPKIVRHLADPDILWKRTTLYAMW
jgi:hypothetical protein